MTKKIQILIIGHNTNGCTEEHSKIAYETGSEIAKTGHVLVTGGPWWSHGGSMSWCP